MRQCKVGRFCTEGQNFSRLWSDSLAFQINSPNYRLPDKITESLDVVDIDPQVGDVRVGINRHSRAGLRANYDSAVGSIT